MDKYTFISSSGESETVHANCIDAAVKVLRQKHPRSKFGIKNIVYNDFITYNHVRELRALESARI